MTTWQVAPTLGFSSVLDAVSFFCEKLGFDPPSELYGPPEERVYAIVRRGGIEVHLQIRRRGVFPGPREAHEGDAYFHVPDAAALRAEFAAKSVKFLRDIQDEPYGLRDFTIETPEGHRLTFGTPL
jgi:Glyoxalase/Bleomycin resistance protein/Dioxygenase superfamily